MVQVLGDSWMAFACEGCRTRWSRTTWPGRYTWARLPNGQRMAGVHIPARLDAPLH
jgi:hypothetical protein